MTRKYKLRYLELFQKDLEEAHNYIKYTLQNPTAAENLVKETEKAILTRLSMPLAFEPYPSKKNYKHPYYQIRVKNYVVLYVVIDNIMEVRGFVYKKRNIEILI